MPRSLAIAALLSALVAPLAAQSPVAQAERALEDGQAWRATQLLGPVVADPSTRTPDAVILAARAAAAWDGWSLVRKLLERESWLDTRFDRLGRRLLAEAALGEQRNPQALQYARLAVAVPTPARRDDEQGLRMVLLARAWDRLEQRDSAAWAYAKAAELLPDVAQWLWLRAAGVSDDSTTRAGLLARVSSPAAAPRIPWTDALAAERADDFLGAAARYDRLGARTSALRMRWLAATTRSDSAAVVTALVALLAPNASAAQGRDALDLVTRLDPPLSRDQRLAVARRAAALNRAAQAVDAFAEAVKDEPLAARDRFTYGTVLGQVGRWPDAAAQFRGVTDPALAGHAAYFNARALLRAKNDAAAISALRDVVVRFPRDTVAAGTALYLLGDLAIDAGQPDSARALFLTLAERFPTASQRSHVTLLAALIAYARGRADVAVRELERAMTARLDGGEADAIRYWLARAKLATADSAGARALWRELAAKGPESYYAVRAAQRLDTLPWRRDGESTEASPDSTSAIFARAARLEALGLDVEAGFELSRLAAEPKGADALVATGQQFLAHGLAARAAQLGNRARSAGAAKDAALWPLLYPLPFASTLRATAAREDVDPLLAASVIRQESGYEPRATSRTDARGLMQVMPAVGRELARSFGFVDFDPALLWIPDVNLALGMRHFAAALGKYPEMERALAAYNAGATPVDRWSATPLDGTVRAGDAVRTPLADPELFIERISYGETRDYVRTIVRNLAVYRMIYGK